MVRASPRLCCRLFFYFRSGAVEFDTVGGVTVLGDDADVVTRESSGIVVAGGGRVIAVAGLDDVVVVDTPDAVLVTTRARAQDVKSVVEALRALGRSDLL